MFYFCIYFCDDLFFFFDQFFMIFVFELDDGVCILDIFFDFIYKFINVDFEVFFDVYFFYVFYVFIFLVIQCNVGYVYKISMVYVKQI